MRNYYLFIIAITGVRTGFISLILQFKHLLSLLLRLEAITINIFILMYRRRNIVGSSGFSALILITLRVCEASLGISILVSIVQRHGNDYVSRFSSQKC